MFLGPENLEFLGPLEKKRCEGSRNTGTEKRAGVGVTVGQDQGNGGVMGTRSISAVPAHPTPSVQGHS